jgi:hypothetical protein
MSVTIAGERGRVSRFFVHPRDNDFCRHEYHVGTHVVRTIHILFGKGRQGHNDTRQVHVFALANTGIVFNPTRHFTGLGIQRQDRQDERPVGHENLLSRLHRRGEFGVGTSQLLSIAFKGIVRGKSQGFALFQFKFGDAVGKKAAANLGSFGIQQDGYAKSMK